MIFRLAKEEDKLVINNLYKSVLNTKNCVWNEEYPSIIEINHDIETNNLYVLEELNELNKNMIIGCISIVPENEMDDFNEWTIKENANEIARVVISPLKQGNGYAFYMVNEIIKVLKNKNSKAIHLSVYKNNIQAYKTYIKAGFINIGEKYMYDNNYYICELNF